MTTRSPAGLNAEELRGCRYAVAEVIGCRRRVGAPIPAWLRRLHDRLDAELRAVVSAGGPEPVARGPDSELVGTAQAAGLLGISTRHVRRLAADLDGWRASRDWVFCRAVVLEYARARKEQPSWQQTCAS